MTVLYCRGYIALTVFTVLVMFPLILWCSVSDWLISKSWLCWIFLAFSFHKYCQVYAAICDSFESVSECVSVCVCVRVFTRFDKTDSCSVFAFELSLSGLLSISLFPPLPCALSVISHPFPVLCLLITSPPFCSLCLLITFTLFSGC